MLNKRRKKPHSPLRGQKILNPNIPQDTSSSPSGGDTGTGTGTGATVVGTGATGVGTRTGVGGTRTGTGATGAGTGATGAGTGATGAAGALTGAIGVDGAVALLFSAAPPHEYLAGAAATTAENGMNGKLVVETVMIPFMTFSKSTEYKV